MMTLTFNKVYVNNRSTVGGVKEKNSLVGNYLDKSFSDSYAGEKTFEKGERKMIEEMINILLQKSNTKIEDINLVVGGDLTNQITSSSYTMAKFNTSFIGIYSGCANSALATTIASIMVENNLGNKVLAFASSNYGSSERQFRYFIEYGIQRKPEYTYTVTGAGGILLSNQKSNIRVVDATIGNVFDFDYKNINNMGVAMAPAAYEVIKEHLKNRKVSADYYDLIVTGDLSKYGLMAVKEMAKRENYPLDNLIDCGDIIYQDDASCHAGGSGVACSALVTFGYLMKQMEEGKYQRILLVATGALMSPTVTQQKSALCVTAHAVSFEVSK